MIGTLRCKKFPFWDFSLCRSKKYSHKPRSPEVTKGTNEAKDYDRFPIGEPNAVSRQCLYQNLGNNGRRNNIDCARPNEALEVVEKVPKTSLLMKNKLQYRPEKETHNPEQKRSCFLRQRNSVIMTVVIFLSSFCLNLLALTPPEGVNYSTEIFCASGLHAEYEEEVLKDRPLSKTETKNKK